MKFKDHLKNYFIFSNTERRGIFLLLLIIASITAWPYLKKYFVKRDIEEAGEIDPKLKAQMDAFYDDHEKAYNDSSAHEQVYKAPEPELFPFDPNTTSDEQFKRLGLKEYQVKSIRKYLNHGGQFKKKSDFEKIYVLKPDWLEMVQPYNTLPDSIHFEKKTFEKKVYEKKVPELLDINTADSASLEKLYGIGPYLAGKISRYRNRLGGFYKKEQLLEVWGMKPETLKEIEDRITLGGTISKINVNTASIEELKDHPYIKWKLAGQIVNYRKQHGPYQNISDFRNLVNMHDTTYVKLLPYLRVE